MRSGWRRETFRHSLAARGITTSKYFARKKRGDDVVVTEVKPLGGRAGEVVETANAGRTPASTLKRLRGAQQLQAATEELVRNERPVEQALSALDKGDYSFAVYILNNPTKYNLTPEQADSIKSAFNARAITYAQAGLPVPQSVRDRLDKSVLKRVEAIEGAKATEASRETESALARRVREDALPAIEAGIVSAPLKVAGAGAGVAEDAAGLGLSGLRDARGQGLGERGGVHGLIGEEDQDLPESPFIKTNVFIGHEEDGMAKPLSEGVPRISDGFNFAGGPQNGSNPVLNKDSSKVRRPTDVVQGQVESLYKDREKLSKVDLKAFDQGNKAFQEGRREDLIAAIMDLTGQQDILRDRWNLINQTWRNVNSLENHRSSFEKGGDTNPLFSLGRDGGDRLADQSSKINEVRKDIVQSNQKVQARKRQLQYRLQRLDATVPPETDTPDQAVQRFSREKRPWYTEVDNPTVDVLRGGRN